MRPLIAAAIVLAFLLAGCASSGGSPPSVAADFSGLNGKATDSTGILRGVVVDAAIKPISEVKVLVKSGGNEKSATSDAQGRFLFDGLAPGTYLVKATHLLYEESQTTVEVLAGVNDPPVARLQMTAKFAQKPYHTQEKFVGYIACGYEMVTVTAPCVTDYTSILPPCPGGCANDLKKVQGDTREFPTAVGPGWQTIVLDLVFNANGQGTTSRMGVLISFQKRLASEWYGNAEGDSPVQLRIETGVKHASEQGSAQTMVDPAGQNDLTVLGSIKGNDQNVGINIQQKFEVYKTDFYNAKPPEGWSFAKGDKFPF